MSILYTSGTNWTSAVACSGIRASSPFQGDKNEYIWEQDFMQFKANFAPLALDTPHPDNSDYVLVAEGERQDMGGGVCKWTRTYAKVPDSRDDHATMNYQFIGLAGFTGYPIPASNDDYLPGRNPITRSVTARLQYDYFLVDGLTYGTPADIPIIPEQKYYAVQGFLSGGVFTPRFTDPEESEKMGVPTQWIWDVDGDVFWSPVPTVPTRADYEAMILAGDEIVAEASQVARWLGNIYVRITKYVVAQ